MRRELATDHAIAALAGRQGGVISRGQLLSLGLSASGSIIASVQDGCTSFTAVFTRSDTGSSGSPAGDGPPC